MYCLPAQTQESWHKMLLASKIPGMFKASTARFFKDSLPELINIDAISIPSELVFHVPGVPRGMIEKALWYVDHQETHVWVVKTTDDRDGFYLLRKDHKTGYKKISQKLVEMYEHATQGVKDRRIKDLEHLCDVCGALHFVCDADEEWGVPSCELNPAALDCQQCKGFKSVGICSHVLALNHILKHINLRREIMEIGKSSRKKTGPQGGHGGNNKTVPPALTRAEVREDDSSDEELYRLLEEGARGK